MPDYFESKCWCLVISFGLMCRDLRRYDPEKFKTYLRTRKPEFLLVNDKRVPNLLREFHLGLSADSNDIDMMVQNSKENDGL